MVGGCGFEHGINNNNTEKYAVESANLILKSSPRLLCNAFLPRTSLQISPSSHTA